MLAWQARGATHWPATPRQIYRTCSQASFLFAADACSKAFCLLPLATATATNRVCFARPHAREQGGKTARQATDDAQRPTHSLTRSMAPRHNDRRSTIAAKLGPPRSQMKDDDDDDDEGKVLHLISHRSLALRPPASFISSSFLTSHAGLVSQIEPSSIHRSIQSLTSLSLA